jgi:hypothetical protein
MLVAGRMGSNTCTVLIANVLPELLQTFDLGTFTCVRLLCNRTEMTLFHNWRQWQIILTSGHATPNISTTILLADDSDVKGVKRMTTDNDDDVGKVLQ